MTKNTVKWVLLCAGLLVVASAAFGAGVPNVDVTISDAAGRLAYRGKTDSNGVFSSRKVAAGNYVVQFNAKTAGANRADYAIYAAAGHQRVVADAVAGSKLAGAGVAMRLKATTGTLIIGQVAVGGVNGLGTKIINGKRYVLIAPQTGELAPRWVEEGTTTGRNVIRMEMEDGSFIKASAMSAAR